MQDAACVEGGECRKEADFCNGGHHQSRRCIATMPCIILCTLCEACSWGHILYSNHFGRFMIPAFVSRSIPFGVLTLSLLAAGCSSLDSASNRVASIVTPYQVEVVQGNFVSQEQAAALQPGMTREQVRMILGTPLVSSLFHADRWDYVFTIRRKGITQDPKHLAVFFKNGVFVRSEGDSLPSEEEFVKNIDTQRKLGKIPPLSASPEQLAKAEKTAQASAAAETAEPPAPARTYPALERP